MYRVEQDLRLLTYVARVKPRSESNRARSVCRKLQAVDGIGVTLDGSRFLGNASVSATTAAFWSDVLTSEYHGYSNGYSMVNGSFGVKWSGGAVTTLVKVTNLFNETIQQHIFGDILRRTVTAEVWFSY